MASSASRNSIAVANASSHAQSPPHGAASILSSGGSSSGSGGGAVASVHSTGRNAFRFLSYLSGGGGGSSSSAAAAAAGANSNNNNNNSHNNHMSHSSSHHNAASGGDLSSDMSSDEDEPYWTNGHLNLANTFPFFFGMRGNYSHKNEKIKKTCLLSILERIILQQKVENIFFLNELRLVKIRFDLICLF